MGRTMAAKIWEEHLVAEHEGEPDLLYVDLHLVHEVTSPQAFESLRVNNRRVRRPDLTVATMDHDVPTRGGRAAVPLQAPGLRHDLELSSGPFAWQELPRLPHAAPSGDFSWSAAN